MMEPVMVMGILEYVLARKVMRDWPPMQTPPTPGMTRFKKAPLAEELIDELLWQERCEMAVVRLYRELDMFGPEGGL